MVDSTEEQTVAINLYEKLVSITVELKMNDAIAVKIFIIDENLDTPILSCRAEILINSMGANTFAPNSSMTCVMV